MSSLTIRVNGGAAMAGQTLSCVATFVNTGGDDLTIDSIERSTPASGVSVIGLSPGAEGKTVAAGGTLTVPFSISLPPTEAFQQYDVKFQARLSDGTVLESNTSQVQSIPLSDFYSDPTADGLIPRPGSLNFNSNTNSALLGAI